MRNERDDNLYVRCSYACSGDKTDENDKADPKVEHHGKHKSYILHHKQPIDKGGEVYNLDNLIVTSPKMHQNVLDPAYHFGNKGK